MSTPPLPLSPHQIAEGDPLHPVAKALNALLCDFLMLQQPTATRRAWLKNMVADADRMRAAALAMMEESCGAKDEHHVCDMPRDHTGPHQRRGQSGSVVAYWPRVTP